MPEVPNALITPSTKDIKDTYNIKNTLCTHDTKDTYIEHT